MIEIVARALCVANSDDPDREGPWADWWRDSAYADHAEAAIAAMREPSDAMLDAGVVHDDATYSTWIAMIDAALLEGE